MTESWRTLLYSLGFLSSVAFGARFLVQWLDSERKGKSVVTPLFWRLSLAGNLLLMTHSFIQVQFHVFLIQVCNAVISWRNLNLMRPPAQQVTLQTTLQILICSLIALSGAFLLQYDPDIPLFRIPVNPWNPHPEVEIPPLWHVLGACGLLLFNSRFWVQWWYAEKEHQSTLGPSFWWLSLIGDLLCLLYFSRLGDPVNLIGPALGLIPYIRNLMLLRTLKRTV